MKRFSIWGAGLGLIGYLLLPIVFGVFPMPDLIGLGLFLACYAVVGLVFLWDYRKTTVMASKKTNKLLCPTCGNPLTQLGTGEWRCHQCQARKRLIWL